MTAIGCMILILGVPLQEGTPPAHPERLKALEYLIGTWTEEGVSPTHGKYVSEQTFEWMQDRNFIKCDFVMKAGEKLLWTATSVIGYDAKKKKIVSFAFARNGAIAQGEAVPAADRKDTLVFTNRTTGAAIEEDRVTQAKVDEDTFTSTVETKKEGKYVLLGTYTYRRKK
jgi:hypothetical protein